MKLVDMKPKLKATRLYFGDNGRIFCGRLKCAGNSAHFTGRTISGQRVIAVSAADAEYMKAALGEHAKCETCGFEAAK